MMTSVDWTLWRSFLAILRAGSLAGAARALGFTHPTLRRHLEELEQRLGQNLFTRSPSGLVATEIALSLRPAAEAMEAAAGQLVRMAGAMPDAIAGTVRISASEIIGVEVLPAMLARLRTVHPLLEIELSITNQVEDVLRRDVDVALRMVRPAQTGTVAARIAVIPLGFFVHRDLAAGRTLPTTLADLATWPFVGQDRGMSLIEGLAGYGVEVAKERFVFRCDSDVAQLAALRAGLGVGVTQKPLGARTAELIPLFPDLSVPLEIWTVVHADLRTLPRIRAVVDHLRVELARYVGSSPLPPTAD